MHNSWNEYKNKDSLKFRTMKNSITSRKVDFRARNRDP